VVAAELIDEVGAIIRETFPKTIHTQTDARSESATVVVDPTQIHQVLMNLCVNARDAMPAGGRLTISSALVEVDRELIETHPAAVPGPHVLIAVTDTGIGIAPDIVDKIYDPFFTTKAFGEGTGLGLSTSLGIVRSHGGILRVTSDLGVGTRFEVLLPLGTAPIGGTIAVAPAESDRGRGERVLLVEDEESSRRALRAILERSGYRVLEAKNGAEGLETFGRHPSTIDAIVTDFSMPRMDGGEFIRNVRSVRAGVPIVLCSGNLPESATLTGNGGADRILAKPFMPADLLRVLREMLRR
jgi:CheY-like chemotaxis protein